MIDFQPSLPCKSWWIPSSAQILASLEPEGEGSLAKDLSKNSKDLLDLVDSFFF